MPVQNQSGSQLAWEKNIRDNAEGRKLMFGFVIAAVIMVATLIIGIIVR